MCRWARSSPANRFLDHRRIDASEQYAQGASFSIGFTSGPITRPSTPSVAAHLAPTIPSFMSHRHALAVIPRLPRCMTSLCRCVANPDLSGFGNDAPARHGRAVGRWRRRGVWRLQQICSVRRFFGALEKLPPATAAWPRRSSARCRAARGRCSPESFPRSSGAAARDKMQKLAGVLAGGSDDLYRLAGTHWRTRRFSCRRDRAAARGR